MVIRSNSQLLDLYIASQFCKASSKAASLRSARGAETSSRMYVHKTVRSTARIPTTGLELESKQGV